MRVKFEKDKAGEWECLALTDGKEYEVIDTIEWHDGSNRYEIRDDDDEKTDKERGSDNTTPYPTGFFSVIEK